MVPGSARMPAAVGSRLWLVSGPLGPRPLVASVPHPRRAASSIASWRAWISAASDAVRDDVRLAGEHVA